MFLRSEVTLCSRGARVGALVLVDIWCCDTGRGDPALDMWPVLLQDRLRMSVREPSPLSRANGAKLVVDHFGRGWRLITKKKKDGGIPPPV